MSKSLGNVYLLSDIINKGYDPLVYRLFTYSCTYRNKLNFTWEGIDATSKALNRLREGYQKHLLGTEDVTDEIINEYENKFHEAINDDLNMPQAVSVVWDVVKNNTKSKKFAELLDKFDTVLGIKISEKPAEEKVEIPSEIIQIAEERILARKNKDWAKSDELRNLIIQKGYEVKDTKNGQKIEKIK